MGWFDRDDDSYRYRGRGYGGDYDRSGWGARNRGYGGSYGQGRTEGRYDRNYGGWSGYGAREGYGSEYQYPRRRPEESPTYGEGGDQAVRRWAQRYGYDVAYEIRPRNVGGGQWGGRYGPTGGGYGGTGGGYGGSFGGGYGGTSGRGYDRGGAYGTQRGANYGWRADTDRW